MPDFCIFMCIYLLLPWVTTSNHSHCSIHCAEKGIPQKIIANYKMLNFECYCTTALYIFTQVPTWFQINRSTRGKPRAFMEQTKATPQKRVAGACCKDRVPWRNTELLHEQLNICYLQQVYKWSLCELITEVYQHYRVFQRGASSQHIRPPHFNSVFCSYSWAWCKNQALKKQLLILFFFFFFGEKLVRKSESALGYNASQNKHGDRSEVPFPHTLPPTCWKHQFYYSLQVGKMCR